MMITLPAGFGRVAGHNPAVSQEVSGEDTRGLPRQRRVVREAGSGSGNDEPHSAGRVHRHTGGTAGQGPQTRGHGGNESRLRNMASFSFHTDKQLIRSVHY